MPFEPLRTDEPRSGPKPKQQDLDTQMLAGCSAFVAVSLISYGLAVWPHFVFQDTYLLRTLAIACAIGLVPAAVFGGYATRKHGLAAAGGFIGGGLASSIFLMLRLNQVILREGLKELPQPEFPSNWQYIVPGAWMLTVLVVVGLFLRREEISLREE